MSWISGGAFGDGELAHWLEDPDDPPAPPPAPERPEADPLPPAC
ncbi:hypothetical protein [Kitasatospora sp. NPDC092286]